MNLENWSDIVLIGLGVYYVPRSIYEYRHKKRGLTRTIGWIMFFGGIALERAVLRLAPSLTWAVTMMSIVSLVGLLVAFTSWLTTKRAVAS